MKNQIETRLQELQAEYQKGQERLQSLEQETDQVRGSMLRISGAIQGARRIINYKSGKTS